MWLAGPPSTEDDSLVERRKNASPPHLEGSTSGAKDGQTRTTSGEFSSRNWESGFPKAGESSARIQFIHDHVAELDADQARALLVAALRDPEADVRMEALKMSGLLSEREIDKAVLNIALQDSDEHVKDRAFTRVNELPVRERIPFFGNALTGPGEETARKAAEWLGVLGGWDAAAALVAAWPAVAHHPARSAAIQRSLQRLTGQQFNGAGQAADWWAKTSSGLDKDLLPKTP